MLPILFALTHTLTCTDTAIPPVPSFEAMQLTAIQRCIEPAYFSYAKNFYTPLTEHFTLGAPVEDQPCRWQGVECDGDRIVTIKVDNRDGNRTVMNIRWLPATTKFVSLRSVDMYNGWTAVALPRDLRFLSLSQCFFSQDGLVPAVVNLRDLPSKMEELHLYDGWFGGPVVLKNLPRTMRVLRIAHDYFEDGIFVDFGELPRSIEYVSFDSLQRKKLRIRAMGAVRSDSRVHGRDNFGDWLALTKHPEMRFDD